MSRADLILPPEPPSGAALRAIGREVRALRPSVTLVLRGSGGRFGPPSARSAFWDTVASAIERHEGLTVAVVDGLAEGAALRLALACDLRLAGPDALAWLSPLGGARGTDAPIPQLRRLLPPGAMARAAISGGRWNPEVGRDQGLWDDALEAGRLEEEVRVLTRYAAEVGVGQVRAMKAMLGG
ncbi:hypothetical protein BCF33_1644 [Hasllibacter halocynthiae]|uniref:Enoyl-CoA hydratase/carnithine racemase n=1 Tax=Hasllibacter halocynthiae TaxID=595589 RepID=A0A2T0X1I0_9RHOB|nr:hypothetical protein [Hasllibacter halocynthiae]PRY92790.1 hypothetical protein BCF33_1644 [Hasllibacter halocynthiae]